MQRSRRRKLARLAAAGPRPEAPPVERSINPAIRRELRGHIRRLMRMKATLAAALADSTDAMAAQTVEEAGRIILTDGDI